MARTSLKNINLVKLHGRELFQVSKTVKPNKYGLKRIRRHFANRTLAKAFLTRLDEAMVTGRLNAFLDELYAPEALTYTVKQYSAVYLASSSTPEGYSYRLAHINEIIGDVLLTSLSKADCYRYVDERQEDEVSPVTINLEMAALKTLVSFAVDNGILHSSPIHGFKPIKTQQKPFNLIRDSELEMLISAAYELDECLGALVVVASETGMRIGELRQLEWTWIKGDLLTVQGETKSKKIREIPLSQVALDALRKLGNLRSISDLRVFNSSIMSNLFRYWSCAREAAKVNIRFHDLRHYRISKWANSNLSLPIVQSLAGHANIQTTMKYIHLAPDAMDQVREAQRREAM